MNATLYDATHAKNKRMIYKISKHHLKQCWNLVMHILKERKLYIIEGDTIGGWFKCLKEKCNEGTCYFEAMGVGKSIIEYDTL
jgi:hypothetical protein